MKLKKSVAELVQWERVCRVATVGRRGMPHLVPVCHVLHGGRIYFASGDDGRKVKNLMENPRVTVTIDCYSDAWAGLRGVMVQGTAKLIERGPRFRRIRALLYKKYPQVSARGRPRRVRLRGHRGHARPRLLVGPGLTALDQPASTRACRCSRRLDSAPPKPIRSGDPGERFSYFVKGGAP